MRHRQERIASLIKEELSKLIVREIEFPESLVTITDVEIDDELSRAIINFSVLPPEKSEMALKILGKNRSHLQYLLLKKINIKPMPQIIFKIDYGLEKAAEIEKILLDDKMNK
jgi:ribosome-binding factor A